MTALSLQAGARSSSPWAPGAQRRRAIALLRAGLSGANATLLVLVGPAWLLGGKAALLSVLVAGALVVAFFTLGQAVQIAMVDRSPQAVLAGSMMSYVVRVTGLGLLLRAALPWAERGVVDGRLLVLSVIVITTGWIVVEILGFRRLRFPVYDTEYVAPEQAEGRL